MTPATAGTAQQQDQPPVAAGMATADNRHQNKISAISATTVTVGSPTRGRTPPPAGWQVTERQRMTLAKTSLPDISFLSPLLSKYRNLYGKEQMLKKKV